MKSNIKTTFVNIWSKKPVKISAIALAVLIIGGIILYFTVFSAGQNAEQTALPTFTAQTSDLSETISLSGNVKTVFLTEVNTQAEGVVSQVYVQNGDIVEQGDKLFEIELSPESQQKAQSAYNSLLSAQKNLTSAEASLHTSQSNLFQANQYFIDHAVAEDLAESDPTYIQQSADWLAAESNYWAQEDQVNIANQAITVASLDYAQYSDTVTAPASGEVQGIAVTEGMIISNTDTDSQRLAVVKTGDTLLVELSVNEMDIGQVQVGQSASITLAATGDTVYQGSVISIDQIGSNDNGSVSYPVLISFTAQEDVTILPNMSADVDLHIAERSGVTAISTMAIQQENDQYFVDVVTGESNGVVTTEHRPISIGLQTADLTEVLSGLNVGETVQMADFNAMFETEEETMMMMPGMGMGSGMPAGSSGGGGMGGGRPQ